MMKVDWYCGTFSMDRTTLDQGEIYSICVYIHVHSGCSAEHEV